MRQPIHLQGKQIFLRDMEPKDATERYASWLNDPEVNRFLEVRFSKQTVESVRQYIESRRDAADERFLAICSRETSQHIGNIKLWKINPQHRTAEISIVIGDKAYWGKGVATEAIRLLSKYAVTGLGLRKLHAGAYASNVGSIKAFEAAGYRREALLRQEVLCDGKPEDLVMLRLLQGELIEEDRAR